MRKLGLPGFLPIPVHILCVHEVGRGLEQPGGILPRLRKVELRGLLEAA